MTALVELLEVNRIFPGARPYHALHDVNLRIDSGEYVALVGPSGAGKSTMLNLLGLMDRPTTGEYRMGGTATSEKSEDERARLRASSIGFVFQSFHLMGRRTVLDNVLLGMAYGDVPRPDREPRARAVLERVGLRAHVHASPTTLSGGERQRVAIARAVVAGPQLLLADEPTGNLDRERASEIMGMFESLSDEGLTVVIITHDADLAQRASRSIRIVDGRLSEK